MPPKRVSEQLKSANLPAEAAPGGTVAPERVNRPHETEVGDPPSPVTTNCRHQDHVGSSVAPGRVICPHENEVGSSLLSTTLIRPHENHVGISVAAERVICPHENELGSSVAPGPADCPHETDVGRSPAPARTNCPHEDHVGSSVAPGPADCPHENHVGDPSEPPPGRGGHWIFVPASTHEKLSRVLELLGPGQSSSELAPIFDRLLDKLLAKLARRVARATPKPRAPRGRRGVSVRHIPPDVRRAVWLRDGGQCAFIGTGGMRCSCTRGIEFEVLTPVEPGGKWTVEDVRLLCRVHMEYVTECRDEQTVEADGRADR